MNRQIMAIAQKSSRHYRNYKTHFYGCVKAYLGEFH